LPDSVFPNNWFSTHKNEEDFPNGGGLFVLYPMRADSREREKNPLIIAEQRKNYSHFIDLQRHHPGQALEGTGSLLFDVDNKKIYCELSVRADPALLCEFVGQFNSLSKVPYKAVTWHSVDKQNNPIYHTNVVMAILRDHVILCTESITNDNERVRVIEEITEKKLNSRKPRKLIDISCAEMNEMAGNMINIRNKHGEDCVIMSERARLGLSPENRRTLKENYRIVSSDLKMIETIGGGSARCMVAELF
jgi:hypothetical protein